MKDRIHSAYRPLVLLVCLLVASTISFAQSTAFSYQGRLADNSIPANGQYDLQIKLFDTATVGTGTQQGSTLTLSNITVTGGIFTVSLDFGVCASCFNGAARFLEIAVKPTSGSTFTTLGPRQPITATPYALKSQNAMAADGLSLACVSCVTSSQIQSVNGSVVSGAIPVASVPASSANYVQNTTTQQAAADFNISGNGTAGGTLSANLVSATTQFNLGANRVLAVTGTAPNQSLSLGFSAGAVNTGSVNTFVGNRAGANNTTGGQNSFFGGSAGEFNTAGINNSFFGISAGRANTTTGNNSFFGTNAGTANGGSDNSFFGAGAGQANTIGFQNAFFGARAGFNNTTASLNAFFGEEAGFNNTIGNNNAFFGFQAGNHNTSGVANAFFGASAGYNNTTGFSNTFFGTGAGLSNTDGNFNTFFGASAGDSNTGSDNAFFGTAAGVSNTTGTSNAFFGRLAGQLNTTGTNNTFFGAFANFSATNTTGDDNTLLGYNAKVTANLNNATAIGSQAQVTQSNSLVLGSINGVNGAAADTRVGIGTTAPTRHLHIVGAGDQQLGIESSDVNGRQWTLQSSSGASNGRFEIIDRTANLSRMTILSTGNVGVGTTSPDEKLQVLGDVKIGLGTTGCVKDGDGTVIAGTCVSDVRFKRDITPFANLLDRVVQLRPVEFYWRAEEFKGRHFGTKPSFGLIAQEVEQVLPELVTEDEQGYKAVNYSKLPLLTLQAVKELKAENDGLRQQLKQQQVTLEGLKKIVCLDHPNAEICKE